MGQCVKDTNLKQQTNCFWDNVLKIQTSGNRPRSNLNGEISRSLDYIRPGHLSEVLIMHHYNKNGNKDLHASIRMLSVGERKISSVQYTQFYLGDMVAYWRCGGGSVTFFIRSLFIWPIFIRNKIYKVPFYMSQNLYSNKLYTVTKFICTVTKFKW